MATVRQRAAARRNIKKAGKCRDTQAYHCASAQAHEDGIG